MDFWQRWVWPAGGSGGIPGDVVGTLVWVVLAAIATSMLYPPARLLIEHKIKSHTAELHRKLDHIIEHHPDIPPLPEQDNAPES